MKKLLVIVGPTGTGKTELGIKLAKEFNGEIISADSRQVYIGMDIGTGKLDVGSRSLKRSAETGLRMSDVRREKECWIMDSVPIHLYDLISPDKTFSVAEYQQAAYKKIGEIHERDKLPILVGGTGLYVRAVVQGMKVPQVVPDKNLREKLEKKSLGQLLKELEATDPRTYQKIDKSNPRRVIRALEVYYKTGQTISSLAKEFKPDFESLIVGLSAPREVLYQKADERIEGWFSHGFVEEVKDLLGKGYKSDLPSMSSLGYRQVIAYIQEKLSLEEAKKRTKFDHHGFIRRQLTWFKKEPDVSWFDVTEPGFEREILPMVEEWLDN